MATGDQNDIYTRLKGLLPPTWFGDSNPILTGALTACSSALAWCYSLYLYAKLQTRISTATDGWLDIAAYDFFGKNLQRSAGQSDDLFRNQMKINLFRERGTRQAIIDILEDMTGKTPYIFEPQRPLDTGAYGAAVAVSRATTATYVDLSGILLTAQPNQVRYGANPYATAMNGLMIERAATNFFLYSSSPQASIWTKSNTVCTPFASVAPDGSNNAAKIIAAAGSAIHELVQTVTSTGITTGTVFTTSVFAKAAERSVLQIRWTGGSTGTSGAYANFDLNNGIASGNCQSCSITPLANGWYLCQATVLTTGTGTANQDVGFCLLSAMTDGRRATTTGTGSDGLYVWGAQTEISDAASSYIETQATQVTRAADVLLSNMPTGSTFSGGYALVGGYGSLMLAYQAFVTAYRPSGSSIPYIAGYSSTPSGYSVASRGEYASQSMITGSITDAQVYEAIAAVKMEGNLVWVRLQ